MKRSINFSEIYEGHIVATNPNWQCGLGDDEHVGLSIYIEITDMEEATGEPEFKDYPYVVSFSIIAANPNPDFYEGEGKPETLGIIQDTFSYMGGVPIDHDLLNTDKINNDFTGDLKARVAKLITHKATFGTLAAQRGKGAEITYPQFKEYSDAESWARMMVAEYANTLMAMVGFLLDRPINLMGESGWGVIEKQVNGKNAA